MVWRAEAVGAGRATLQQAGAAVSIAVAAAMFLGGGLGLGVGAAAGAGFWVAVGRLESPPVRLRRERLEAELPHAVDLLAACLAGGHPPGNAAEQVAEAVEGPVGEELKTASARLRLGVDPVSVWQEIGHHPQLGPLGRCVSRALDSGASVAEAMTRLAEDLRRDARSRVESRARGVGVKAAVPLGVCMLPAFVLIGVVPLVAGSVGALLGP
ncbi:hypothetical protein BH18ACT9_BH18ACT9_13440 [soil metagenome]